MKRGWKTLIVAMLALFVLIVITLLTLRWWLPRLADFWLPSATVRLDGNLRWRAGGIYLPGIEFRANNCQLAKATGVTLSRVAGRWALQATQLQMEAGCLSQLPSSNHLPAAPRSLAAWQEMLPKADITIHHLNLTPWQTWAGSLTLNLDATRQNIIYRGEKLSVVAVLEGQRLEISSLTLNTPEIPQPISVTGNVMLPKIPDTLPDTGNLVANFSLDNLPAPLKVSLNWQQKQGKLTLQQRNEATPLVTLPWQLTEAAILIREGQWRWPYSFQPLSGGINLTLRHWQQGLAATEITGRLNLLTQGRGGKGNVVLALGPGNLSWTQSHLPFRLTGEGKLSQLLFFAGIPGELQGPVLDPQLLLKPGALLRMRGRLLSALEVDEARWPLSGISVSAKGIDGRLQAILTAKEPQTGQFRLHLDGSARAFWPDQGEWQWRYWGKGRIAPLAAKWDVKGCGRWQNSLIELTSFSGGFNQVHYGNVTTTAPVVALATPVRWQRDDVAPSFSGKFILNAPQTQFRNGGYLPPANLTLDIKGRDPAAFQFTGRFTAGPVGPVKIRGRWDGERLRGQGWWPEQSLKVFQPLLSEKLKMEIQHGTLKAQVAFSAAGEQGFEAGGHWVVSNGSVWTPDNALSGISFSLPFRLKHNQWFFGARGPVSLRIKEVKNQFILRNIRADLQGWYPWNKHQPLRLSNVGVEMLDGQLSLLNLQIPQTEAAMLRLKDISMSELVTAIQPKKIAMSGRINATLPLWLNNSHWLVKEGLVANSGPLTFRLDKDFADALANGNIAAGAAMEWLRYIEISRSWATMNINSKGEMKLTARVNGISRFSDKNQRVLINYTQQENLFQLWRSLRFGDNLQSAIEQHTVLPEQQGKTR